MVELQPGRIPTDIETEERAKLAIRRIAAIALFAIVLGFVMQGLILAAKLLSGGVFPGLLILADLAQGVTWSLLICIGVGIGTSVIRARAALAGIMSAAFAPVSLAIAKSSQKVIASALGAVEQPAALSLVTISVLRAVEYGILGWLLAKLVQNGVTRGAPYLGVGAAVGIVFGGAITFLNHQVALANGTALGLPQISATLVNELFSPLGCALVIFSGHFIGQNLSVLSRSDRGS